MTPRVLFDPDEVRRALCAMMAPDQVVELRVLDATRGGFGRKSTHGGFFDNADDIVAALGTLKGWTGAYITINPLQPELLARRCNRIDYQQRDEAAADKHVLARRWLPFDVDPVRTKGISASDEEHEAALALTRRVAEEMQTLGWPAPLVADSGNGGHAPWRCDLPVESDLPKRWLAAMKARFETATLTVDGSVFNPARIWKLYGTLACKGEDMPALGEMPARPWRMARLIEVPEEVGVVAVEQLEAFVTQYEATLPPPPDRRPRARSGAPTGPTFDAVDFMHSAGFTLGPPKTLDQGGTLYELDTCACGRGEKGCALTVASSGAVGLGCKHESCDYAECKRSPGDSWMAFRARLDGEYQRRREAPRTREPAPEPAPNNSDEPIIRQALPTNPPTPRDEPICGDDATGQPGDQREPLYVSNFLAQRRGKGARAATVRYEVGQLEIVGAIHRATGNWPRTANGLVFAATMPEPGALPKSDAILPIDGADVLFAWLRDKGVKVEWTGKEVHSVDGRLGGRTPITRREAFEALKLRSPNRYDSFELLPHHPARPGTFYACGELPSGDGTTLDAFLALLNPDTAEDRQFLEAALLTPFWGGEPGTRPGFVITSEYGVGAGKTATVQALGAVCGGVVELKDKDEWAKTVERLLSDNALTKRIAVVDNIKGKLSSQEIESAVTAPSINGKRMYHGDFERPNTLTWFFTVNLAELSRDLADRCVVIRIGPQQHGKDFVRLVADFLREQRFALVCDIVSRLRSEPRCIISRTNRDRFQAWQDGVLARMAEGDVLAAVVKARRPTVDVDTSEAQDVADELAALLRANKHCPKCGHVWIPTKEAMKALRSVKDWRSEMEFKAWLKNLCVNRPLRHIDPKGRLNGANIAGIIWRAEGTASRQKALSVAPAECECPPAVEAVEAVEPSSHCSAPPMPVHAHTYAGARGRGHNGTNPPQAPQAPQLEAGPEVGPEPQAEQFLQDCADLEIGLTVVGSNGDARVVARLPEGYPQAAFDEALAPVRKAVIDALRTRGGAP